MDVRTIGEDAAFELPAAMRFLIADIVTMRQRTRLMLKGNTDMTFRVMKCNGSYVHCALLNKRFGKCALIAVYVWGNISVRIASYLMIHQRNSTTAVVVESAGLVGEKISSIAIHVGVVIQSY